ARAAALVAPRPARAASDGPPRGPAEALVARAWDRAAARRLVRRILDGTADPDGRGLLVHGSEFQPAPRSAFEPHLLVGLLRLAGLAGRCRALAGLVRVSRVVEPGGQFARTAALPPRSALRFACQRHPTAATSEWRPVCARPGASPGRRHCNAARRLRAPGA